MPADPYESAGARFGFGFPGNFFDYQFDRFVPFPASCVIAVADAHQFVAVVGHEFFRAAVAWFKFEFDFHGIPSVGLQGMLTNQLLAFPPIGW